jgi:hypothetical protein
MISGENLRRGAVHVVATLLHEAAHARNLGKGVLDTDVNGRHSRKFADVAEEHGLQVVQVGWHGWTGTTLDEAGQKRWRRVISTVERGLTKSAAAGVELNIDHLGLPPVAPTEDGDGSTVTLTPGRPVAPRKRRVTAQLLKATCGCGYSIRLSRKALDACRPTCQECEQEFVAV